MSSNMSFKKLNLRYGNHVVQIRFTSLQTCPIMVKCPIPTHFQTSHVTDKKMFPNTPETRSLCSSYNYKTPLYLSLFIINYVFLKEVWRSYIVWNIHFWCIHVYIRVRRFKEYDIWHYRKTLIIQTKLRILQVQDT